MLSNAMWRINSCLTYGWRVSPGLASCAGEADRRVTVRMRPFPTNVGFFYTPGSTGKPNNYNQLI